MRVPLIFCNAASFLERPCRSDALLQCRLGIVELSDAITKEGPALRTAREHNLAQGTNRVMATNNIRKLSLAPNPLKVLRNIVNQRYQITIRNDILGEARNA